MLYGAHLSAAGGIDKAVDRIEAIGGDALQVFTQSPRMWRPTEHAPEATRRFRERREETGLGSVVCHALYLVNLGTPDPVVREKSLVALRATMHTADAIGAEAVIIHAGSHLGAGFEAGVELVTPALRELLELTTDRLWLCLENCAGTGGTIGRSIGELATLVDAADRHPRLGICLDSCHWWASGVDVTDQPTLDRAVAELDDSVGLDRLRCLHVNDSKTPLGSNRDRHDTVGLGLMGNGLATFLGSSRLPGVWPPILETPRPDGDGPDADGSELQRLRGLHASAVSRSAELSDRRGSRGDPRRPRKTPGSGSRAVRAVLVARERPRTLHIGNGGRHGEHRAEPLTPSLRRLQQVEVDLDREHLLHAPHVRVTPRLVRVDERARPLETRSGMDDLVAVDVAASALDLVLGMERKVGGSLRDLAHDGIVGCGDGLSARLDRHARFRARAAACRADIPRATRSDGRVGRSGQTLHVRQPRARASHDRAALFGDLDETLEFILAAISLIPLAWLIGEATEHAAEHTGPGIGGFLNATFGNAPELIIALLAVNQGLTEVVRGSLTGSVIGNLLLVLGFSLFAGGRGPSIGGRASCRSR